MATRGTLRLALAVGLLASALAVPAAHARGSLLGLAPKCGPTSKPFAQFSDFRNYTFGTNGGLESGSTGWTLSGGAKVVAGNESYFVHSRYDSHSLFLPVGSSATSPPMCMGTLSTWIRFFTKSAGPGSLRVQVQFRSLLGSIVGLLDWATISGGSSWAPTPSILNLQSLLSVLGANGVQLRLIPSGSSFQVDDIYVDPWASSD